MRFLNVIRVQNAPYSTPHGSFFAKHRVDWKERYHIIISWEHSSIQFMLTWWGFGAMLHDGKPVRGTARRVLKITFVNGALEKE